MVKNQKPSWIDGLKSLATILASTGIIVIVLLETIQALCRYCFRFTFQFVDDVVVVSFAWAVFAGAAAAYRAGMHLRH